MVRNLGLVGVNINSLMAGTIACVNVGLIENCFATGIISYNSSIYSFQFGGIAAANSGTVQNCYSDVNINITGMNDTTWLRVGGIVGSNAGQIINCVALGAEVSSTTGGYVGRVLGTLYHEVGQDGAGSNNYANADMTVNGTPVTSGTGLTTIHGADVTAAQWGSESWWRTTLGWDFDTVWKWNGAGVLPTLRAGY